MTVVGPDGNIWSNGDTRVQGAIASVAVRPLGPAGTYTVNYRVTFRRRPRRLRLVAVSPDHPGHRNTGPPAVSREQAAAIGLAGGPSRPPPPCSRWAPCCGRCVAEADGHARPNRSAVPARELAAPGAD